MKDEKKIIETVIMAMTALDLILLVVGVIASNSLLVEVISFVLVHNFLGFMIFKGFKEEWFSEKETEED